MSKTHVAQAAFLHCAEVFDGVRDNHLIRRAIKSCHQAFQYGAIWQREQDDRRIRGLKSRITNLLERLEESNEHSRTENDHRYDYH